MSSREQKLLELQSSMKNCMACPLATCGRTNIVHGRGNIEPDFFLIGEAPGAQEDIEARPFVGRSGKLLRATLLKILPPEITYYVSNTVKCRPPQNRNPTPEEKTACATRGIFKEIEIVNPRILIPVGAVALSTLLPHVKAITQARQKVHFYKNIPVIPALHPAYCLRNPSKKVDFEQDFLFALAQLKRF